MYYKSKKNFIQIITNENKSFETRNLLIKYWSFGKDLLSLKDIANKLNYNKKKTNIDELKLDIPGRELIFPVAQLNFDNNLDVEIMKHKYVLSTFGKKAFMDTYNNGKLHLK